MRGRMSEPKYPFAPIPYFPPQQTQQQQPTYYQPPAYYPPQPVPVQPVPAPEPKEELGVWCDACGELIEWEEEAMEIAVGMVARGKKSGQPVVVATAVQEIPPGIVHIWCGKDFINKYIDDGDDEDLGKEPVICAMCEEEIDQD